MPSSSTSSSTSSTYDHTTGQDLAYKQAQERSGLQASAASDLYGGNIESLLASANRIRDIQAYLKALGVDGNDFEVVPRTRLASTTISDNSSQSSGN